MKKRLSSFKDRLTLLAVFCAFNSIFFLGARRLYQRQTPAYRIQKELNVSKRPFIRALFSPDDGIEEHLIGLIDAECERIALTAFAFTSKPVTSALINAASRGVKVQVIADGQNSATPYSKINQLEEQGIPVWLYPIEARSAKKGCPRSGIMHNKFIVFSKNVDNKKLLWTGSYNFTKAAHESNQENVLILDDPTIIDAFIRQFELLKKRCRILNLTKA